MKQVVTGFVTAACLGALILGTAHALEKEPFSMERFEKLQSQNELVLVDIYASWCGTCAEQQEILQSYMEDHPDVDLHVLEVDFDEDKEWVSHFRAPRQSTILIYAGKERYSYTVAETDQDRLYEEINQAADAL